MRQIQSKHKIDTEFHVLDLSEPTVINFEKQIEDIIVTSPEGDILIGWDYERDEDFTPDNCMLLREGDKMKEISKERCTKFYLMPKEPGQVLRVYVTAQK
jgi:hypothetical protein